MKEKQKRSGADEKRAFHPYVPIGAAIVAALGSIVTVSVGKLWDTEILPKQKTSCSGSPLINSDSTVISGQWLYYDGYARFSSSMGSSGLLLGGMELTQGTIDATIRLAGYKKGCKAQIAFGRKTNADDFISAGLGGEDAAYTIGEYSAGSGWRQLQKRGSIESLNGSQAYKVRLTVTHGNILLQVNEKKLGIAPLDREMASSAIGLWVEGCETAEFICPKVCSES